MYPVADGIKFRFGEEVDVVECEYKARVKGKIKNTDCYIILFQSSCGETTIANFKIRFGIPNRHLDLEWGKFSGYPNEYVVPSYNIKRTV